MGDKHGPIPTGGVSVLLLDSAQGQPIQTWRFTDEREITIGREDTRDVVVTEKDAVKIRPERVGRTQVWVAPLDFAFDDAVGQALMRWLPPPI